MALMAVVDATAVVEHGRATVAVPLAQQPRGMIAPHGGARMTTPTDRPRRRVGRIARGALAAVALYLLLAYLVLPAFWRHHEHLPAMAELPQYTRTAEGLQGDALNVALVGSEEQVREAFATAGWRAAAPITLESSIGIAESVLLDRPDATAPVSTLMLWDRKQDLAFEQEVGESARERNHVRFWRSPLHADGDRPLWVGAASRDRRVELSHRTAQITHQIAPDIDTERDLLIDDLDAAGWLARIFAVTGIGPTLNGRNGGGDRYFTDGELYVGMLASSRGAPRRAERLPDPTPIVIKNTLWSWLAPRWR